MVDRAALEMRSTRKGTGGSNPSLSANSTFLNVCPCRYKSTFSILTLVEQGVMDAEDGALEKVSSASKFDETSLQLR